MVQKYEKNARKLHERLIGLTAAAHHAANLINAVAKRCHKDTADAVRIYIEHSTGTFLRAHFP